MDGSEGKSREKGTDEVFIREDNIVMKWSQIKLQMIF